MIYYIMMPGDTEKDTSFDTNVLGEVSFNSFYCGQGLTALMKIVDKHPELLPDVTIKTSKNETLTVEQFLTQIQPYKIIYGSR